MAIKKHAIFIKYIFLNSNYEKIFNTDYVTVYSLNK